MKKQNNSGRNVPYVDGRSSAWPSGVFFTSAKSDSLSAIHRDRTFPAGTRMPAGQTILPRSVTKTQAGKDRAK